VHRLGPFARTMAVDRLGPFYPTCNIFYPRELLERLGGFDETFTAPGGEDTDLAWRALEAGVETVFAERALVRHAVEDLGPAGHLRVALRWADAMAMFRHPGLREEVLFRGIFWKPSHELLVQTVAGALLARRFPPALLLAIPYLRHLRSRCWEWDAPNPLAAYFVLHDLLETYTTVRGAIRHRVLVI
jgi:GT2 family glycosyltransferase